jgi:hypothetical protein
VPLGSKREESMLFLVYREDENQVRYLVGSGLSEKVAEQIVADKKQHACCNKNDYVILEYETGQLPSVLSEHNINR